MNNQNEIDTMQQQKAIWEAPTVTALNTESTESKINTVFETLSSGFGS